MIRPVHFAFNAETAVNNAFQSAQDDNAQLMALKEFDDFVSQLRHHDVDVTVIDDTPTPHTPDSIFPNNWISFHDNGQVVLYPMYAANRRLERKPHVLEKLKSIFRIAGQVDLSGYEDKNIFLEGTGSMVLDRVHHVAYACLSPRTNLTVLSDFCVQMGFAPVTFTATDAQGLPIYHTNVMMCVADRFVVICLESIPDEAERVAVTTAITANGQEVIPITLDQMNHFAGNMLQVESRGGKKYLVMSTQAYRSLRPDQQHRLAQYNPIIHSSLDTIERNGGGSARCMMAEVFLPTLK